MTYVRQGDISFQACAQPVRRSFPQTWRLTVSKALEDADVCLRVGTDRLKTETKRRLLRDVFSYDSYIQGRSLQLPRLGVNLQVMMSSLCRLGFLMTLQRVMQLMTCTAEWLRHVCWGRFIKLRGTKAVKVTEPSRDSQKFLSRRCDSPKQVKFNRQLPPVPTALVLF